MAVKEEKIDFIRIEKHGNAENIILFTPFYPFSFDAIKKFFLELKLDNYELHFSALTNNKNKNENISSDYKTIYEYYAKYIKQLNKKITPVIFGIFTNLFVDLCMEFPEKINLIYFIEPDFSNIFFKNIFHFKKILFSTKIQKFFYMEKSKIKINNADFSFIDLKYLKKYYQSSGEPHFKELLETLPAEIDLNIYKNKIKNRLSVKDNLFFCKYYTEKDRKMILNKELPQIVKIKLRNILVNFKILPEINIIWNTMSRESWPLPQALEEYKIPLYNLPANFYSSLTGNDSQLKKILKNNIS